MRSTFLEAEFQSRGFTTERVNGNEFCVTAGPGGAPIVDGSSYANSDTGFDMDSGVYPLAGGGGGGVVDPGTKDKGVGVPLPPDNASPLPAPGLLDIEIEIERDGARIRIRIRVQLPAGLIGPAMQQVIRSALEARGFHVNDAQWSSLLRPGALVEGLLIDRTSTGDPVHHIRVSYDRLSRRAVPMEMCAGLIPVFGATEYGIGDR